MPKPKITLLVDALLLLCLAMLAGLGLLIQFVLTPAAGSGGQVTLTWLGLPRPQWETVYFAGLLLVLALAAVHLLLHRAWYVKLYEAAVSQAILRSILAPLGLVAALLLLSLPLLARPYAREGEGAASPPVTPPPAPAAEAKAAGPVAVQPSPKNGGAKTAALRTARPRTISRVRRPVAHRAKYRHPAHYGKWSKGKHRYCPRGPYPAYVLAARRH